MSAKLITELVTEIAKEVIQEAWDKIPRLPDEIISMILYKYGGLQHPIVPQFKMLKQVALKHQEEIDPTLPSQTQKFRLTEKVYDQNKELFHLPRKSDMIHATSLYTVLWNTVSSNINGEPYYSRTYEDWGHLCGLLWKSTTRCGKDKYGFDRHVRYKDATIHEIIKYWRRHLVSIGLNTKQLKELLDMNQLEYPKSASKKRLLQIWYKTN